MRMWIFKWAFWLNDLSHCGQLYFLTRLWMREWVFKCSSLANALLHCWQLYFLTPVWICLWLKKLPLLANDFGHTSQEYCWGIFNDQVHFRRAISFDCCVSNVLTTFPFITQISNHHIFISQPFYIFSILPFKQWLYWYKRKAFLSTVCQRLTKNLSGDSVGLLGSPLNQIWLNFKGDDIVSWGMLCQTVL